MLLHSALCNLTATSFSPINPFTCYMVITCSRVRAVTWIRRVDTGNSRGIYVIVRTLLQGICLDLSVELSVVG